MVHLTAPGVPDIYRGDELWCSTLVDPDNRRPVNWSVRARALQDVAGSKHPKDCLPAWRDDMDVNRLKCSYYPKC